jgi:hypothetical protein
LLLALAVPAVLVYRDHARLRVQAADLIETGAAVASEEIAKWQARSVPPQPSVADTRAVPPAAQDRPAAAPAMATIEPRAAPAPAQSTADDAANPAVVAEPAPPNTEEATVATAAPAPTVAALPAPPAGPARFTFAERTVTVGEGETSARIVIRRTGSLAEEASVAWWTADRSALADEDYAVLGARIERFAPGEESRAVHIPQWFIAEDDLGSIEPGNHADLAVLDRDFFKVPDEQIKQIRSVLTVIGGEIKYDAGVLGKHKHDNDDQHR